MAIVQTTQPFERSGRFRAIAELGRGGMGVVWDVWDSHRKERLALKGLRTPTAEALYRLKREFRALAALDHPNLIKMYDLVQEGPDYFFTMERVEGTALVRYCNANAFLEAGASRAETAPEGAVLGAYFG